jgi:hypothetical protein
MSLRRVVSLHGISAIILALAGCNPSLEPGQLFWMRGQAEVHETSDRRSPILYHINGPGVVRLAASNASGWLAVLRARDTIGFVNRIAARPFVGDENDSTEATISGAAVAKEEPDDLKSRLASIAASGALPEEMRRHLNRLARYCKESPAAVIEMSVAATQIANREKGISVDPGRWIRAVDRIIPTGSPQLSCADLFTATVALTDRS